MKQGNRKDIISRLSAVGTAIKTVRENNSFSRENHSRLREAEGLILSVFIEVCNGTDENLQSIKRASDENNSVVRLRDASRESTSERETKLFVADSDTCTEQLSTIARAIKRIRESTRFSDENDSRLLEIEELILAVWTEVRNGIDENVQAIEQAHDEGTVLLGEKRYVSEINAEFETKVFVEKDGIRTELKSDRGDCAWGYRGPRSFEYRKRDIFRLLR
jgi:DNA-binding transcriptional regulator YiaG